MPSPKWAERCELFSPVPSQRTLEFFGSMTMQQLLNAPPSSKIGVKETPRLTVFQTPPNAAATYQTLVLLGSIFTSATRPVTRPGPIERTVIDFSWSAVSSCAASVAGRSKAKAAWRTRIYKEGAEGAANMSQIAPVCYRRRILSAVPPREQNCRYFFLPPSA